MHMASMCTSMNSELFVCEILVSILFRRRPLTNTVYSTYTLSNTTRIYPRTHTQPFDTQADAEVAARRCHRHLLHREIALELMTSKDLREACKAKGVKGYGAFTKAKSIGRTVFSK